MVGCIIRSIAISVTPHLAGSISSTCADLPTDKDTQYTHLSHNIENIIISLSHKLFVTVVANNNHTNRRKRGKSSSHHRKRCLSAKIQFYSNNRAVLFFYLNFLLLLLGKNLCVCVFFKFLLFFSNHNFVKFFFWYLDL